MKNLNVLFFLFLSALIGCTNQLDKKVNNADLPKVIEIIEGNDLFGEMKKKYIIDNLRAQMNLYELGKKMQLSEAATMTFREVIDDLASDYDSRYAEIKQIRDDNVKLMEFATLVNAKCVSTGRYEGYLNLDIEFNNVFDKDVLYSILNYKYINDYDRKYFDENVQVTDRVAGDFDGIKSLSIKEEYNDVARFMYSEVPVRASQALRDELGEEEANEKVHREFLMSGLQIEALRVVFNDKTEIFVMNGDWEYFE